MATSTDEILVKFTTEGGQEVVKTFKDVSDQSDQFHQKVSKAGGALGDLTLKSEGRVAHNIGNIASALTSGGSAADVFAKSIGALAESFRGSLLFAGGAVAGLALYEGITKAGEAVIQFHSQLADLRRESLGSGDFLSTDRINQNLDQTLSKLSDVRRTITTTRALADPNSAIGSIAGIAIDPIAHFLTGKGEQEREELKKDAAKFLTQLGDKQEKLNDVSLEALSGDEQKAAIDASRIESQERIHKLLEQQVNAGIQGTAKAREQLAIEDTRQSRIESRINKQFEQRQFQLDLERDLARAQTEFLTPQQQSLSIAEAQVKSLERQLQTLHFLSEQERQRLGTAKESAIATETRAVVQRTTSPLYRFNAAEDRSVAARIAFEQAKLAADPNASDNADRVRHIKELQLFQDQQRLNNLNDVRSNTINFGASGRDLDARQNEQASNLRQRINAERASLGLRAVDEQDQAGGADNTQLLNDLGTLIQTLNSLPAKIGVQ